jgi:2-oxo-3-hexenedioate decarboxylase
MGVDLQRLAQEISNAYARRERIAPFSAREPGFDLETAYRVEAELARMRAATGTAAVGRKVGFANRALWRVFKLDSVAWAHMYEDTVHHARAGTGSCPLGSMVAPKIEPEIVFKLKRSPSGDLGDPVAILEAVEWLAPGFELVDCVFPDWKFTPADFVASFGLHAGLIVGEPLRVTPELIPSLAEQLGAVKVALLKDGQLVAEGSGQNVLKHPALSLGELAAGLARQGAEPLAAGEVIASGALTDNQFIAPGETWRSVMEGLAVKALTVHTTA